MPSLLKQISRRNFVSSLGLMGAAFGLNPSTVFAGAEKPGEGPTGLMKCKPYLQAAQPDRMTIRWITHAKCYSWVEYGESAQALGLKAHRLHEGLVQANTLLQDIALTNLQPGKTYFYRAVSKRIEKFTAGKITYGETESSAVYSFTTPVAQAAQVQFSVFNDVHDRPESFAHLMQYKQEGKNDFVLLNGDIFSSLKDGENQVVDHLIAPLCDLFATHTPFVFARGNHEARGEYARQLPDYLNGRAHKFYYSFQAGPVYAIVLDSGEDKEDENPVYGGIIGFDAYRLEQKQWLQAEIQKKEFRKARYKVVFSHIPPYYTPNKDAHGTTFCRENWVPLLNKAGIDLMISGHTHKHGMHPPVAGQHSFPIVIGGGPKDGQRTLINVKADRQALVLNMVDDQGKTVGSLRV